MKILRIISSIKPENGGPINAARQIDSIINASTSTVEVLTLDEKFNTDYPTKVHFMGPSRFSYGYNSNIEIWLLQNAHNYDFFIINGLWQHHGFVAHKVLHKLQRPYIVYTHGMLDPWFKKAFPLKHLKKWLYWPWGEYKVLRDARAVIFTSQEERVCSRKSFWLYKANEIVTAYGTSAPPKNDRELSNQFLSKYPTLKNKRIMLFLSRIHEKKGCDLILEAFAAVAKRHKDLHLVMAGPDQNDYLQKLHAMALHLNIADRITWTGMLHGDAKWGAFYASEVFCLPSHQENFGIVVAEALACGKPVLISNKVNIWHEIKADGAGFVSNDDTEGTLRNIKQWLELDQKAYQEMSGRATLCFANRFHIKRAAERVLEIAAEYTK